VFSKDVARAVVSAVCKRDAVAGLELNIAGKEQPTVGELLALISELSGRDKDSLDWNAEEHMLLPSVDFGPVDSTLAREKLEWEPTPLRDWIRETLVWYDDTSNCAYTMAHALKR